MTTTVPAIPDPTTATVPALHAACHAVRAWADSVDDLEAATEALDRIAAVERYLTRKGAEGPAQSAARWLEVRIGDLLGPPAETNGRPLSRDKEVVPQFDRWAFRKLAAYRNVVGDLDPSSRRRVLQRIDLLERTSTTPNYSDNAPTTFPTIVIDPPWRYDNVATRGAAKNHYDTLSLDDLADPESDFVTELQKRAETDCHLYLWTTNGFLRQAFDLLDAWKFTYKTTLTWCKPQIGTGNWFRNATEHVLFAVRGNLPTLANDVPTWFLADRTTHSSKPDSFYDLVERSSPGPYLDMFARQRRLRWHTWGNEA